MYDRESSVEESRTDLVLTHSQRICASSM